MIRNGEITPSEVKRILRKHWWIPTITMIALGAAGLGAALVLPKKYTSSTLVLIERSSIPEPIRPAITDDINQRMAAMKAQILSRSRL